MLYDNLGYFLVKVESIPSCRTLLSLDEKAWVNSLQMRCFGVESKSDICFHAFIREYFYWIDRTGSSREAGMGKSFAELRKSWIY